MKENSEYRDIIYWIRENKRDSVTAIGHRIALRSLPLLSRMPIEWTVRGERRSRIAILHYFFAMYYKNYLHYKGIYFSSIQHPFMSLHRVTDEMPKDSDLKKYKYLYPQMYFSPYNTFRPETENLVRESLNHKPTSLKYIIQDTKICSEKGFEIIKITKLWPDLGYTDHNDVKNELYSNWNELKKSLIAERIDYDVWTQWYDDVLNGKNVDQFEHEIRSSMELEWYDKGAAAFNFELKRRLRVAGRWEEQEPSHAPLLTSATTQDTTIEPKPGAYNFGERDGRIIAVPTPPDAIDISLLTSLQSEALAKAKELFERLREVNAPLRPIQSIERLLDALKSSPNSLNPGTLLSRMRSIETDRKAYDSEQGRAELFPDAIAKMADLEETARDLLAVFPSVRKIEAERVAQEIASSPERIAAIVEASIAASEVIAATGIGGPDVDAALKDTLPDIAREPDFATKAKIAGDQQLILMNLWRVPLRAARNASSATLAAAGRAGKSIAPELGGLGKDSWRATRQGLPDGIKRMMEHAPSAALIYLLFWLDPWLATIAVGGKGLSALAGRSKETLKKAEDAAKDAERAEKTQEPAAKKSAVKKPAVKKPAVKKPVVKKPAPR